MEEQAICPSLDNRSPLTSASHRTDFPSESIFRCERPRIDPTDFNPGQPEDPLIAADEAGGRSQPHRNDVAVILVDLGGLGGQVRAEGSVLQWSPFLRRTGWTDAACP